ncbi:hypothetical protein [Roseovarius sp. ZX-A-9]|uniref:hypothetical protein n=1 Tax=Roseovarius sp. ZX-A-9 TaxID=3014783 RepID=UPI00232C0B97|nr:hypothetical protein [Roseovarius sp. ZX-A-9]
MYNFQLSEGYIGGAIVEIDTVRYEELLHANAVIKPIWDLEDTFSLLANSFIELEEYFLSLGISYFYQKDMQRDMNHFFDDVRQGANLKLISALTASRVYEEQLHRKTSLLSKLTETKIDLCPSFSSAFDESIEYRVMYALRNHAQHRQLPLTNIIFSSSNLSETGDMRDGAASRHRITIDPKISVTEFCNSDKIKSSTREEVRDLGYQYLDLKFFMRGFLSCLAVCHEDFRKATEPFVEIYLTALKEARDELWKLKGDEPKHICIFKRYEGRVVEKHYIDYTERSRLRDLRGFWTGLQSVQRGYVSSEVKLSKDTYPEQHEKVWIAK